MPAITITIPHDLGRVGARARIEAGFGRMREQFTGAGVKDFEDHWEGDALLFSASGMGQKIAGKLDVRDKDVLIEVDLPWMLAALSERIKGGLEQRGKAMLEHKPGS